MCVSRVPQHAQLLSVSDPGVFISVDFVSVNRMVVISDLSQRSHTAQRRPGAHSPRPSHCLTHRAPSRPRSLSSVSVSLRGLNTLSLTTRTHRIASPVALRLLAPRTLTRTHHSRLSRVLPLVLIAAALVLCGEAICSAALDDASQPAPPPPSPCSSAHARPFAHLAAHSQPNMDSARACERAETYRLSCSWAGARRRTHALALISP